MLRQTIRINDNVTDAEISFESNKPNKYDAAFFLKFNEKLHDLFCEFEDMEIMRSSPCEITIKIK